MKDLSRKQFYRFLLLLLFAVSFFAVRMPLLHEPLGFEEGIFADLIVNRPNGPHYALGGRIDGENIYGYISHPAVSYELLRLGGFLAQELLDEDIYLNDASITPRLRLISSMYQFVFWGGLLTFVLWNRRPNQGWPILVIFAAMLSPLAIKTSVHLQIDNTSGVILCGTASLLFIAAGHNNLAKMQNWLLFTGGIVAGLGKQEWSFALLAGLLTMAVFASAGNFKTALRHRLVPLCWIAVGLLTGNAASYLYDPVNYLRGLHYIVYFSKLHETSAGNWDLAHWVEMMKLRLPFIYVCLAFLTPILYTFFLHPKKPVLFYLTALYGCFLLAGYILSDWNYQTRYFCPALAVIAVSAIMVEPTCMPKWYFGICLGMTALVPVTTAIFLIGYKPDRNPHLEQINSGLLRSATDTVLYINSGAGWNKPGINYVNNNSPFEAFQPKIKERYDKQLVRPENALQKQD